MPKPLSITTSRSLPPAESFAPADLEALWAARPGDLLDDRATWWRRQRVARPTVFVGTGTCGVAAGARETIAAVEKYCAESGCAIDLVEVGCVGLCSAEPLLDVQLPGRARLSFSQVTAKTVRPLLDEVLAERPNCEQLLGQYPCDSRYQRPYAGVAALLEHPFFARQTRWVLRNCGVVDPSSIDAYIASGGYRRLAVELAKKQPEALCEQVLASGLRGRGGGGFATGRKWLLCREQAEQKRYLICNADEGDPGAFMDRAIIEGDPHRLIEGMAIAAYAIGASCAYVYIRAEYPLAIERLQDAIAAAERLGLLGQNIFDSGFDLEIRLKVGAGAFVCGEETALIHSIEGKRGMPRPRPPYPAQRGLFGYPTIINNVETLANLPGLVERGAEAFAAVGTEGSKGTKVFALSGHVMRTGLVEVAMGTSLAEVVNEIGGGVCGDKPLKAVQIGGPSGGCIPADKLDTPIEYDSLRELGAMMGSGGLVVMDESTCMVDVALFFMDFIERESCGKCIPCRQGTRQLRGVLEQLTRPRRAEERHAALSRFQSVMTLEQIARVIQSTSLCGLGQSAPNPVLSTLRWFRDEYEQHVFERQCPAGACKQLLSYRIVSARCKGCGVCKKACPADAIVGERKSVHHVIGERCVACGACLEACRLHAVEAA
jgi:NADH:ubiquinone oxidoreductase subunit F (NADH-binding)/NAD-dependent dihydropyrimidine dehydrogenase PreA subunit/(2Fe-2S) ferredoxin